MAGSMRERKRGVWELRVYAGRDPLTDKHVYVSRTVHGSKRQAELELAKLVADNERTRVPGMQGHLAPQRVTVEQLIEAHLARKEYSPTTLADYASVVKTYIRPTIGGRPIQDINPALLDRLYAHLRTEFELSPTTIRKVHALLSGAFRTAEKWGWLPTNPARNATPPTVRRKTPTLPSAAGLAAALADADEHDPPFGVFIRVAAATGARRGEVCALRWSSIDLDRQSIRVEASLYTTKGGGSALKGTKSYADRSVSIDPLTADALRRQLAMLVDRARVCEVPLAADAFVFTDAADGSIAWRPDRVSHAWDRTRERVGLTGVRLHDLRHFQATMLLQAGVAVANVSKRIGHRDTATTLNVYAQFLESTDREAASIMGNLLPGSPTTSSPMAAPDDPDEPSPDEDRTR